MSTNWFPEEERAFATMIGCSSNILGVTIGFALPSLFVDKYTEGEDLSDEVKIKYRYQVWTMMTTFAAFALFSFLQIAFIFKERPDEPFMKDINRKALLNWNITSLMNQSIFSIGKRSWVRTQRAVSYLNHDSREMG